MPFNKAKALQEAEKYVSQGKIPQAIKQYKQIVNRDPSDLALLNTIGDLYVRERNMPEALDQFYRLAEAYVEEGFTVKAIAMYKKISKLGAKSVDPLLRLAELYQLQGFAREAREQYFHAVEFYRKKGQDENALEVLYKVVQLDPENATYRSRLAMYCEQMGRIDEAARSYLEGAELALQRNDLAAAEPALKKASDLSPKNVRVQLLRAHVAMQKKQAEEVERIIKAVPELHSQPAAKQLLLQAYVASHKLKEAEELVIDVYHANPSDFSPVAGFVALCVDKEEIEAAYKTLSLVAEGLIQQRNTGPLIESLRRIWSKTAQHIPTLELLYRVCEASADEFTLPEVVEALGHAYVQVGRLEDAERAYGKLLQREPENEHYRGLLKQVLQKEGKEPSAAHADELSESELALALEGEEEETPEVPMDPEQEALVKEALENSDFYSRYNLTEKAVAELEKVLETYPDQIYVHQRILEMCRKGFPSRAAEAAAALSRIFRDRGDLPLAEKYAAVAGEQGTTATALETPPPQETGQTKDTATGRPHGTASDTAEFAAGLLFETSPAKEELEVVPVETPSESAEPPALAKEQPEEIDLTGDLESLVAAAPVRQPEELVFNYEESRVEIGFYLENGFADEARKAVADLEEKFPGDTSVAELRDWVDSRIGREASPPSLEAAPPETAVLEAPSMAPEEEEASEEGLELTEEPVSGEAVEEELGVPEELTSAGAGHGFPAETPVEAAMDEAVGGAAETEVSPSVSEVEGEPFATPAEIPQPQTSVPESAPEQPAVAELEPNPLGELVGELSSAIERLEVPPPSVERGEPAVVEELGAAAVSPLSDLLAEMEEPESEDSAQEDPETHYNLGVAFREMGLLEEAIGEFQKVLKGAGKGKFPPNFLQVCSLLAICFMEKKMPAVATKWYARALETPDLDEQAILALQYDLGTAFEQAGDARTALEKFTEVYSQNIDFRDVAEKIRTLQQKVS